MKTKKFILAATTVLTLSLCSLQPAITAAASGQSCAVEQQSEGAISPRSDAKTWIYKIENSKVYKRLYNASTGEWIGDWIYVGPYPG